MGTEGGEGGKGKGKGGREGGKGGEVIIYLLLPQSHTAVAAYMVSTNVFFKLKGGILISRP